METFFQQFTPLGGLSAELQNKKLSENKKIQPKKKSKRKHKKQKKKQKLRQNSNLQAQKNHMRGTKESIFISMKARLENRQVLIYHILHF